MLVREKYSSLLDPFVSYTKKEAPEWGFAKLLKIRLKLNYMFEKLD